ncbi:MAG: YedE-related selenium metabolism membrane protein [Deltaproteobacteria bacterium]|nr:MAG: YedE-related selenium metabolism membrane protein [Deltaproteobacteria bacterium]
MALSRDMKWIVAAGLLLGVFGSLLSFLGNPPNTGICISCFMENSAGAMGLHDDLRMRYFRPELTAFILGSFLAAIAKREFKVHSKGSGLGGFTLGFMMIVGSAVFIGCPIKLLFRLAGGDLAAVSGLFGLIAGVMVGLQTLRGPETKIFGTSREGSTPLVLAALGATLLLTILGAAGYLLESKTGGGAMHAPTLVSIMAGLILGAVCQRSRFCVTGSLRDVILTHSPKAGLGLYFAFGGALLANLLTGQFHPGYFDQPGAHLEPLWGFAGMALTGWAAVLAGGCPFRQLIKAGEGDLDGWMMTVGMLSGAAAVQLWSLDASSAGVTAQGKAAVLIGFALLGAFSLTRRRA